MEATHPRLRWLAFALAIAGIVSLLLLYGLLWQQLIGTERLRTTTDFIAFFAAGRIAQTEGPAQVYDLESQREVEEGVLGTSLLPEEVNPFVHPPFIIPLLELAIRPEFVISYWIWAAMSVALFLASTVVLVHTLPRLGRIETALLFLACLLFFPAMVSLLNGQDSAVLLLGGTIWSFGLVKGKSRLAGLGLALTAIRPQLTLVLALPLLFDRRYRVVFWWFCLGCLLLAIFSFILLGLANLLGFLRILTVSASGEGYLINEMAMLNLIGLLRNLFPAAPAGFMRTLGWGIYMLTLLTVCLLSARRKLRLEQILILVPVASLFFSPHLHYHDLVLLLLPLAGLLRLQVQRKTGSAVYLISGQVFLSALLLANHISSLPHIVPFVLMGALSAGGWLAGKTAPAES